MMSILRTLAQLAVVLLFTSGTLAGPDFERWFIVEISGAKSGWMMMSQRTEGEQITTASDLSLEIRRGKTAVSLTIANEFTETVGGKPLTMMSTTNYAREPVRQIWTFHDDHVIHEVRQGGRTTSQRLELPEGAWLTPAAADDYTQRRLAAGAKTIVVRTITPALGLAPTVITREVQGRETLDALGKPVEAVRCKVTQDAAQGAVSVEHLDERGLPIRTQASIGGLVLDMKIATREEAVGTPSAQLPEIMISTFITPDRTIARPRTTTRARYRLTTSGDAMPEIPETAVQRVEKLDENSVRVIVNTRDVRAADLATLDKAEHLASTALLDHQDPRVRGLRDSAVARAGDDPHARAEAMRRYVYRYITDKNLDVGFASASEVARSRAGDCSEHAVLLAAMLRADSIPSRVVSGVMYADEFAGQRRIFGYHMWTQALLNKHGEPTWVDLDATLNERPFDATHIALGVSPLRDGLAIDAFMTIAELMGRLNIVVESVE